MASEPRRRQVRLFLGVRISVTALRGLAEVAESLRKAAYDAGYQIRWVAPANYHITLKFLGATAPESIEAIRDRLSPRLVALPGFEFSINGVGAFPSLENARVIWAGVDDPSGGLLKLAEITESELTDLGFQPEARPFHPHVTLGRVKRVDNMTPLVRSISERIFRRTRVDSVVLFESIMKPVGSEYVERARFELLSGLEGGKRHTEPLKRAGQEVLDRDEEDPEAMEPMDMESSPELAVQGADELSGSNDEERDA